MVFIVAAAAGLVILVGSLVLDGIFDVFHADFGGSGLFSAASVGGFITGFGLGGLLGESLHWPMFLSILLGIVIGVLIAWIAVVFYRFLRRSELPQETFSTANLVGSTGVIVAGTTSATDQGLVRVTYLGAPRTISYVADDALTTGTEVTVTALLSDNVVKVIDHR